MSGSGNRPHRLAIAAPLPTGSSSRAQHISVIYQSEGVGVNFFLVALVNFYAAARQAAGSSSLKIPAGNLGALIEQLSAMNPEMAKLIPTCSFLVNGVSAGDSKSPKLNQTLVEGDNVDVLPQFAGG